MKIVKITAILLVGFLTLFVAAYISIPVIIQSYLPSYLTSNFPINKFDLDNAYYSSFSNLNIDNLILEIDKKDIDLFINIPRITVNLEKFKRGNYCIYFKNPVILGKFDLSSYDIKNALSEAKTNMFIKKKELQSFAKYILDKCYIEKGNGLIRLIEYKDFEIKNLKLEFIYDNKKLMIKIINAGIFKGSFSGDAELNLIRNNILYQFHLNLYKLDLSQIAKILDSQKYELTGEYNGEISLVGENLIINKISGDLTSTDKGGKINIKETNVKNLMKKENHKIDLPIEQLKNFTYSKGTIQIKTSGKNLYLHTVFKGKQGKKDIEFVFHNLLGGRKWFVK